MPYQIQTQMTESLSFPASAQPLGNMRIHLIRHAESMGNVRERNGVIAPKGCNGDLLSVDGHRDARVLVDKIDLKSYDKIYCSPYHRAMQTLAPSLEVLHGPVQTHEVFSEIPYHPGLTAGRETYDLDKVQDHPGSIDYTKHFHTHGRKIKWGSNPFQVAEQINDAQLMMASHNRVLVVTHGNFISKFLEMSLHATCRFRVDNCSVTELNIHDDSCNVGFINRSLL